MIDAAGGLLAVALRLVALTAVVGSLGAWVFARFVLPRLSAPTEDPVFGPVRRASHRSALVCTAALALSTTVQLTVRALSAPTVNPLTLELDVRRALAVQAIAAAVAYLALVLRGPDRGWPRLAEVGLVLFTIVSPFLAHAGGATEWRSLAIAVDLVHVIAAGSWVGALALLTAAAWRLRRTPDGASRIAALIVAFHPVAVMAAPTVFLTGLLTAWLRMGVPEGIANPTYSGLFVAKLLLAGVVGYFGAGHSKLAVRRVATVPVDTVGRTLLFECAFAVAVLFVTAILVGTNPIG